MILGKVLDIFGGSVLYNFFSIYCKNLCRVACFCADAADIYLSHLGFFGDSNSQKKQMTFFAPFQTCFGHLHHFSFVLFCNLRNMEIKKSNTKTVQTVQ